MTYAVRTEAGTVSHGTLKPLDLLSAFVAELRALHSTHEMVDEAEAVILLVNNSWALDADQIAELVDSLQDELDTHHAGPGLYFGPHWGDASDFGFWPVEDGMPS